LLARALATAGIAPAASANPQKVPAPPPTHTDNVRETLHGVEIVDPYRWLEDQQSTETVLFPAVRRFCARDGAGLGPTTADGWSLRTNAPNEL